MLFIFVRIYKNIYHKNSPVHPCLLCFLSDHALQPHPEQMHISVNTEKETMVGGKKKQQHCCQDGEENAAGILKWQGRKDKCGCLTLSPSSPGGP